jgi:hypothetical protein
MRERICGMLLLAAAAMVALPGAGQNAAIRPRTAGSGTAARPPHLPYTAEFKTTRVQTLPDGNTITFESTEVQARDLQGRWYSMIAVPESGEQMARKTVNINDPVAGTVSNWNDLGQRVTVSNFPGRGAAQTACAANPKPRLLEGPDRPVKPVSEDLGNQTIQGVEAHGWRTTRKYPEGAIGNSAPLVRTEEHWNATGPGLDGITLRQESDDPRTGKMTKELVKFTPGEPDVSIFQAPADYQVVTQETHSEVHCPE